jgi:hypothetical protein
MTPSMNRDPIAFTWQDTSDDDAVRGRSLRIAGMGTGPARIRTSTTVLVEASSPARVDRADAQVPGARASMDLATWGVDK